MSALFDSGNKVNAIHLAFIERLGFMMQSINIGIQKINGTTLKTYEIVIAVFSIIDLADGVRFFEKTFLIANFSLDIVFRMPFFILSGIDIDFSKKEL